MPSFSPFLGAFEHLRIEHGLEHGFGPALALPGGEPPDRALAHRHGAIVPAEQDRRHFAQRGLVADDEHPPAIGPRGLPQQPVRAPLGTPVRAVWDGKVVHAGWFKGYGNLIILDHGDGIFSLMAHLDQMERSQDEQVHAGDRVGTVGDSGSLKGAYLYFELRDGQKPLDPERWVSRSRKGPALLAGAKGGAAK